MIAQERVAALIEVLSSEQERSIWLAGLESIEALRQINILGHDFTLEEIQEFGALVREAQNSHAIGEELSLDALDEVAGGCSSASVNLWSVSISINW